MENQRRIEILDRQMVNDFDRVPLDSARNQGFQGTSDKAIQFKAEMECIDEMLLNTNTINLEELRSACRVTTDNASREDTHERIKFDNHHKFPLSLQGDSSYRTKGNSNQNQYNNTRY